MYSVRQTVLLALALLSVGHVNHFSKIKMENAKPVFKENISKDLNVIFAIPNANLAVMPFHVQYVKISMHQNSFFVHNV